MDHETSGRSPETEEFAYDIQPAQRRAEPRLASPEAGARAKGAGHLTASEAERLRTWAPEIAAALLPGVARRDSAGECRFHANGKLCISKSDGAWYDHAAGRGGWCPLALIRRLKDYSAAQAIAWARTWLTDHVGMGVCNGDNAGDDAAAAARAEFAAMVIEASVPVAGTPAEVYLNERGLVGPFPDCVRYFPDARLGEGALVGILTAGDKAVGVQIGYLDPQGRKSTVAPQRRVFLLDTDARGVFAMSSDADEVAHAGPVIAEGVEDALSLAQAGAARAIIGVPGIARLGSVSLKNGECAVVFRDGDPEGSPADKALAKAIDRLLLDGATVRVTSTPAGGDANSILQSDGPAAIHSLVRDAQVAELSAEGEVQRLSRLDRLAYEIERAPVAKRLGIRATVLDGLVKQGHRETVAEQAADPLTDEPWTGEVELGAAMDAALAEIKRYVVADEAQLAAAIAWAVHTHLVHSDAVNLAVSPKLAIQAPDRGCGKSTLLEVLGCLAPRSMTASSISAAAIYRVVEAQQPTLFLDEADRMLNGRNDEMVGILNSSHRRAGAFVMRTEEVNGTRVPVRFSTWCGMAFAGISTLPDTLQDRSIVVTLRKALSGEVADHLRDGSSPALTDLRRQFAAWAAALIKLPDPEMPAALFNRSGDNWRTLFAIAALAGPAWIDRIKLAAMSSLPADNPGRLTALLTSIRKALEGRVRIGTTELLDKMNDDQEEDWSVANRGKKITSAWLRERLKQVIKPPHSQEWKHHGKDIRGYSRQQFDDAWQRYLPPPTVGGQPEGTNISSSPAALVGAQANEAIKSPVALKRRRKKVADAADGMSTSMKSVDATTGAAPVIAAGEELL